MNDKINKSFENKRILEFVQDVLSNYNCIGFETPTHLEFLFSPVLNSEFLEGFSIVSDLFLSSERLISDGRQGDQVLVSLQIHDVDYEYCKDFLDTLEASFDLDAQKDLLN